MNQSELIELLIPCISSNLNLKLNVVDLNDLMKIVIKQADSIQQKLKYMWIYKNLEVRKTFFQM